MKTEKEALKIINNKYPHFKSVDFQLEDNGEISYQTNALNADKVNIKEIQKEVDVLLNRRTYTAKFVYYISEIHASNAEEAKDKALKINDLKGAFAGAYEAL